MTELSCAIGLLLVILACTWAIATNNNRRRADEAERRERGSRIADLMARIPGDPVPARLEAEVSRLLRKSGIGYFPELVADDGWFVRARPALSSLWHQSEHLVDEYFATFIFPAGHQQHVLVWLMDMLQGSIATPEAAARFVRVAERVIASGSSVEARWMYDRTLDTLVLNGASTPIRVVALRLGRLSYAAARPDRKPTVYDEQAIANDLSVRVQK